MYTVALPEAIDNALKRSYAAFELYRNRSLDQRAQLLYRIADELQLAQETLINAAQAETNLETHRLQTELQRTCFQLTSYADACVQGTWLEARIDLPSANQPHDLRKMLVPLGPVVVFGASNFPFAYSTAGGDTACALAAGCTVVVKAHPAHAHTSELVAECIHRAIKKCNLPNDVFIHLHGASFEVGKALVQHPLTKAVGFTGSLQGGRTLFDIAAQRPEPIPVFAEMGSTNPVFLLPQKLAANGAEIAQQFAQSITSSAGQFCTAPGIMVGIQSKALEDFKTALADAILKVVPVAMLHKGIVQSFHDGRSKALATKGMQLLTPVEEFDKEKSLPTLAQTSAQHFLQQPHLLHEVFGPYCLLVECADEKEMMQVAKAMPGQLTTSLMATEEEATEHKELVIALQTICGRIIFNGVPTGVQLVLAMHHGGPYPATTDSRFTAVGGDGIKRFARPVCYQNWAEQLLPDALKKSNPLGIWRTVNNILTKETMA